MQMLIHINVDVLLLAVDIKAAFDTISPDLVKQVMKKQQYPETYLSAIHNLTSTGEAVVLANAVKRAVPNTIRYRSR